MSDWHILEGCRPCNFQCDCCYGMFSRCCSGATMWVRGRGMETALCNDCYRTDWQGVPGSCGDCRQRREEEENERRKTERRALLIRAKAERQTVGHALVLLVGYKLNAPHIQIAVLEYALSQDAYLTDAQARAS